jgi:molybdopterin molybdotransferase
VITVEEARSRILAGLAPVGVETVALSEGWGRVLAAEVVARVTQPPAALSAMDGYAVRAHEAQAGACLPVVGAAPAGHPFEGLLPAGSAIRLFTGSVLPDGADSVVMQENVTPSGDSVTIDVAASPGRHVRRAGQDFSAGASLLAPGRRLTARDIGLAAAANHPWLSVYRRPRIALLATGDEIAMPGEAIPPGGIISSNSHALAAMVRAAGGEPVLLPLAVDDLSAIGAAADHATGCDLLVTSGGASVGDHDLVQAALAERGLALDFWKIAMRPGKPLMHGRLGALPMLGLPGNPVSAIVCATLFLLPAMAVLAGQTPAPLLAERARLGAALGANDQRADFLRARLARGDDGGWVATGFTDQASSLLAVLASADALILRQPHAPAALAGDEVEVIRLAPLGV